MWVAVGPDSVWGSMDSNGRAQYACGRDAWRAYTGHVERRLGSGQLFVTGSGVMGWDKAKT